MWRERWRWRERERERERARNREIERERERERESGPKICGTAYMELSLGHKKWNNVFAGANAMNTNKGHAGCLVCRQTSSLKEVTSVGEVVRLTESKVLRCLWIRSRRVRMYVMSMTRCSSAMVISPVAGVYKPVIT